jgi:glyoxylase I family protein
MGLAGRIDHVSFHARDLDEARGFYVDLLGCEEIERPDLGFPGMWLRLGGAVTIHVLTAPPGTDVGTPPSTPTNFANHVAITVEDHARTMAELRARGLDVHEGTFGITQLFLQDPSGNVIELLEQRP